MKNLIIDKPIFFVGAPRSGTTIIFEALSTHGDVAWFSNWLTKYPKRPILSLLSRISSINMLRGSKQISFDSHILRKFMPHPDECYPVWKMLLGEKFLFNYLIGEISQENERIEVTKYIKKVMFYHGKRRFAAKLTGPTHIAFLNSIFPDAIFVHIIRDGRAVIQSLLNISFWEKGGGFHKPWWTGGLSKEDIAVSTRYKKNPAVLAAVQWRRIVYLARSESKKLNGNRYLEIKYENFISDPHGSIKKLVNHCSLKFTSKMYRYINKIKYKDMNYKYKDFFVSREINDRNIR
jgi:hypothetical protein